MNPHDPLHRSPETSSNEPRPQPKPAPALDLTRWAPDTLLLHAGADQVSNRSVAPPIYQTSTYRWSGVDEGLDLALTEAPSEFYARWGHPNARQLEAIVAALEKTPRAIVASSGAAAMALAIEPWLGPGNHAVLARTVYGETRNLLTQRLGRFGVRTTTVPSAETDAFARAIVPGTRVVVVETPANPTLDCVDIAAVAELAHAVGARLVVDSTFASPMNTRPAELGADAVVHSATKYLAGHSDVLAGVLATDDEGFARAWEQLRIAGAALGPFEAWLVTRGLRTLALRMARHNENAMALAQALEQDPRVLRVHYPGLASHPSHAVAKRQMSGFGGMLSVELRGGIEAARQFAAQLELFAPATSLGGVESLVQFPAMLARVTPEEQRASGIAPGLVRLSVGCEATADLLGDISNALPRR